MAQYFAWIPTILVFKMIMATSFCIVFVDYYGWQIQLEIVTELNCTDIRQHSMKTLQSWQ